MKEAKRYFAIIMAVFMLITLTACGNNSDEAEAKSEGAVAERTEATESEETPGNTEDSTAAESEGSWEDEYSGGYESSGDEQLTWAYITMAFTDTFTNKIMGNFEDYTAENFPGVELMTADGENEASIQISYAENYAAQGVDCLILNPTDSDGCVSICGIMKEAGVPLVVINTELNCTSGGKCPDHYYIGSDHYQAGQLQAEYLINDYDDTDPVQMCYLKGTSGYSHSKLRFEGFFETLDNAGYNYELLSSLEGNYYRDKGMDIAEDWIISYGDEIDVIGSANDEMAMGAMGALQAAGIIDTICLGVDANDDALEAVAAGKFGCTIFQNAYGQAKWSAIAAYAVCTEERAQDFEIPYELVTKDNVEEYMN